MIWYVLSAFFIYQLLLIFVQKKFALFGTFLFLFYPFYIYLGSLILTEGIYTPFLIAYVYYSIIYIKNTQVKNYYISIIILSSDPRQPFLGFRIRPSVCLPQIIDSLRFSPQA